MRRALLGVMVVATSCADFTLVEPEPGPGVEPIMSILLRADRSGTSRYELRAVLFPGIDSRGQLGEVADPILYVEGTAVQPDFETDARLWFYTWEETRADGGSRADSVRIRLPMLAGSSREIAVTLPVAGREGPEEVTWAEGEDLRLQVSPTAGATGQLATSSGDWRLELGEFCGGAGTGGPLLAMARGAYPPELRVPWEWLRSAAQAPTAACLRAFSIYRVSDAPYRVEAQVDLRLSWRIRMAGTS